MPPEESGESRGRCPECGAELAEGAPPRPCRACLMKLGISGAIPPLAEEPEGADASAPGDPEVEVQPMDAAPPPPPKPPSQPMPEAPAGNRPGWRVLRGALVILVAVVVVTLLGRAVIGLLVPEPQRLPEYRLTIDTPGTGDPPSLAVSPDGRFVVFVASDGGRSTLWIRPMASTVATPIAGTEGASYPFWSPDGRHVAFFADGALRRIGIGGDPAQTLAEAPDACGGVWQPDGTILFVPECEGGIARVSAAGGAAGEVEWLTHLDEPARESGHRFPSALPDPEHFLFLAQGVDGVRSVNVMSLRTGERRSLFLSDSGASYSHTGHVLYVRDGRLLAVPFDVDRLETGEPFLVAEGVASDPGLGAAALSVSAAGPIVFRTGPYRPGGRLVWVDRAGSVEVILGEATDVGDPTLSPDGTQLAFRRTVNGNADIWILDLRRAAMTRFTFDPAADDRPLWSPDAQRIVFRSQRGDGPGLYVKLANGAGSAEPLSEAPAALEPTDWSPDGRLILAHTRSSGRRASGRREPAGWGIVMLDVETGETTPIVDTEFDERDGQLSPDGRWIAYESNQSGRPEVFLRSFGETDGVRQVSIDGGSQPRWSPDGRELFYLGEDGVLMAVPLEGRGNLPDIGRPEQLFFTHMLGPAGREVRYAEAYDRFVFVASENQESEPLTVLLNWQARPR